nr:MAG TPA: hypothetical protein [Caudoviricetes sp.]
MLFPKILITPHNTFKTGSSFLLHSSSLSSAPLKLTLSLPSTLHLRPLRRRSHLQMFRPSGCGRFKSIIKLHSYYRHL